MTESTSISSPSQDQLHALLRAIVEHDASDLHIREHALPFMRRHGGLEPVPGFEVLDPATVQGLAEAITERRPNLRGEVEEAGEADLSYELADVARYRVNIFKERGHLALTLRVIPNTVPNIDDIGVPEVVKKLSLEHHGLVLVTGATGSGKTTTLAAMIDHRNRETNGHILTIEDPIEIVHPNHRSIVSQREVGADTKDFGQALRRALRQDPDVILIGEIRDEETMRTALAAAETGHLVLATLHTINAQETIARVLDLFPSEAEPQARAMLAGALKGIVSQRLAKTVDGGRTAVVEVMVNTARVQDCITNPDDTAKITEAISDGEFYGMQTFDQALIKQLMAGRITEYEATHLSTSPQNFKLTLEATRGRHHVEQQRQEAERVAREEAARAAAEAETAARAEEAARIARMHAPAPLPGAPVAVPGQTPTPGAGIPAVPAGLPQAPGLGAPAPAAVAMPAPGGAMPAPPAPGMPAPTAAPMAMPAPGAPAPAPGAVPTPAPAAPPLAAYTPDGSTPMPPAPPAAAPPQGQVA